MIDRAARFAPPTLEFSRRFWQDRRVLVTGASGLVGTHLVRRLSDLGAETIALVRDWTPQSELYGTDLVSRVRMVKGDVVEQETLERTLGEYEVQTVIHLAAQTIVGVANANPVSTFESNIRGTWSLLEACRRSPGVRQIVVASSDKAYGSVDEMPYTESTPLEGRHPYDVSKSCADLIAQSYATTYSLPVCVTRCGNFFGPGDLNWNRIVPGTIRCLARGERPIIRSDGKFVRDYFYVEDGAIAYMTLAEQMELHPELQGEAFNFSLEQPVDVLSLVRKLCELMGAGCEPVVQNRASHEIREQWLSAEKARTTLGWRPRFTMEEGLKRTVAWYVNLLQSHRSPEFAPAGHAA